MCDQTKKYLPLLKSKFQNILDGFFHCKSNSDNRVTSAHILKAQFETNVILRENSSYSLFNISAVAGFLICILYNNL